MLELTGHLYAYWEQGWEGRIAYAFAPDSGERPIFLLDGQHLTIWADDGTVIWAGDIALVQRRWWDRVPKDVTVWAYTKQKGVKYADWLSWFWRKRPLRATLHM